MTAHHHAALVVEDHADAREALEMLIEAHGFSVIAVRTGGEALARLRAGLVCCLIILDWWLPDMNGAEFLEALAADTALAEIPAVMCTGDARIRHEVQAQALRVKGVYVKPLDTEKLFQLLESHCTRSAPPPEAKIA